MFLDVHAHFAEDGYDIPAEREKIRAAGVVRVILAGDTVAHSRMHRDLCAQYPELYFTAGVHPSEAAGFSAGTPDELRALLQEGKCVAVGEIGLDYHWDTPDRRVQQSVFSVLLLLAHALALPVQIHSRDCCADMLAMLRERRELLGHGFLMHCYSHGAQMLPAFAALDLDTWLSLGYLAVFASCIALLLQNIAVALGFVLVAFLACFSGLDQLTTPAMLLYQIFWILVILIVARLRKP